MLEAELLPEAVNQAVTIVPVDTMAEVIRLAAPDLRTYAHATALEWATLLALWQYIVVSSCTHTYCTHTYGMRPHTYCSTMGADHILLSPSMHRRPARGLQAAATTAGAGVLELTWAYDTQLPGGIVMHAAFLYLSTHSTATAGCTTTTPSGQQYCGHHMVPDGG